MLDLLIGREKLKEGLGSWAPLLEVSELKDGERGGGRNAEDMGECGIDMALLEESLRGFENVDPAVELL